MANKEVLGLLLIFGILFLSIFIDPPANNSIFMSDGIRSGGLKAACEDRIDNDNDGRIDFPDDAGCIDSSDNDETDIVLVCNENWKCEEDNWGICRGGAQEKICIDLNECGTTYNKPLIQRECIVNQPGRNQDGDGQTLMSVLLVVMLFITVFVLVFLIIYVVRRQGGKNKSNNKSMSAEDKFILETRKIIKSYREQGYTNKQLREMLKKKGWDDRMIGKVL